MAFVVTVATTFWTYVEHILERLTAKPFRVGDIPIETQLYLNHNGHVEFAPDDIENPKNWSPRRRWYITISAMLMVVNANFASSSPSGCIESISEELHVSVEAANLVTTMFLLGYAVGPLLFAPLSEFYGRRYMFYITFSLYIIFNFLCAFTPNFGGLLVGRFLTGTFASAPLSNTAGVLADIWGPIERGKAMVIFAMMNFAGPALGPVVAGFLEVTKNWRWAFYVLLWMGAGTWVLMLTLPETLPGQVLTIKAQRIRQARIPGYENVQSATEASNRTLKGLFKVALTRPWIILFDTIALLVAIYLSIVYALLYMLFTVYPIVFQQQRGWNAGVGALPLIGLIIGAIIAAAIVFYEATHGKKKMLAGIQPAPEDRMPLAMIGGIMFPITMFWFAWSANFNYVHWIVPTIAGVFLGTSVVLIFVSYLNYLTDSYLVYAASAMAGNTVLRSVFAASAPLWTSQMFKAMGVGGAGSLIGGVACLLAGIPFLFYKYGRQIRIKSPFAPTEDKPAQEKAASVVSGPAMSSPPSIVDRDEIFAERSVFAERSSKRVSRGTFATDISDPYVTADEMEKGEPKL